MGINPITNGPHIHVMLLDFKPHNFFLDRYNKIWIYDVRSIMITKLNELKDLWISMTSWFRKIKLDFMIKLG